MTIGICRFLKRPMIAGVAWLLLGTMVPRLSAFAVPQYAALGEAAVNVKFPAHVGLVAIVRAGPRLVAAGLHGVIIFSDDNGKSWHQGNVPVNVTLTSIYFKDAKEGWSVGHYGVILHTTNGGKDWQLVLTGLDVIRSMDAVAKNLQASSPNSAEALLQQRVAVSFSRGGPDEPFLGIGPCGPGVLAVGAKDMAMFSRDGKNWADWTPNIINPLFRMLYAVLTVNDQPVLVGETGLVAFGDPVCTQLKLGPASGLPTLFGGLQTAAGDLLVYGLNGTAAKSSNNGATWTNGSFSADAIFEAGLVVTSGIIYLGDLNGQVYQSADNGNTFQLNPAVVPFQISAMAQAADGSIIVAGSGGIFTLPAVSSTK